MKSRDILATFNRGQISRLAVARVDVERVRLSADIQTNTLPRVLGSMSLRPGTKVHENGATVGGDGSYIPFVYSRNETAILELSAAGMRIWDNGDTRVTRETVTASIVDFTFVTDLTGWGDYDETGAASTWATGGYMQLLGTGFASARRVLTLLIPANERNTIHGVRIVIERGPVIMRIGSGIQGDDVFRQTVLRTGVHSIAFDPGGNAVVYIELSSTLKYPVLVDSVTFESGVVTLPTPWATDAANKDLRWHQSGDVIFVASGLQQRRIERRDNNSWSVVAYEPTDGPFLTENVEQISITPSAISGEITLTATQPIFRSNHVGAIWRLTSQGQRVEGALVAELTYTNPIRVTGVGNNRRFTVSRTGTWSGTLSLQRSVGDVGNWVDVASYTANNTIVYDDGLDNTIAYYRIGFNAGDYTSGTANVYLEFSAGSITGVARITGYTSETEVDAIVLSDLGAAEATTIWAEGAWSDLNGWPTAVAISDGRLWWFGKGRAYGSISDAYSLFDPDFEGDAAPINRAVSESGGVDCEWALALDQLFVGTSAGVHAIRSSSLDEPVTPTNYNVKSKSSKGAAAMQAARSGNVGYYVGGDGVSVYELRPDQVAVDYGQDKMTVLVPEITEGGVVKMAVQEEPDLRVWCVLADGTAALLIRDEAENVVCWIKVVTDGVIEDVAVLPSTIEDRVFFRVKRTINGSDVRYHEELTRFDQCVGGQLSRLADSHITGAGVVSGLGHLEGETVVVWADGADQGSHVVSSGALPTLTDSFTTWCAGLGYSGTFRSAKLAGQTGLGISLTQRTRINKIGLVLADTHAQGLEYGPDFDTMDNLPLTEDGADVADGYIWDAYDKGMVEFPGDWSTDNRICLRMTAPRPCTVCAAVINIDRQDHD